MYQKVNDDPCELYAVIQHSSGPQGGYVVRTVFDGYLPAPYRREDAVEVFENRAEAERFADAIS